MIRVKVECGTKKVQGYFGDWHVVPDFIDGELINVLWHPIDGPMGAVLTEGEEIELFELSKIQVKGESK